MNEQSNVFLSCTLIKITESLHALLVEKKKLVNVIGFLNNPTSAIKSLKVGELNSIIRDSLDFIPLWVLYCAS
jgi:hypothetical protein